MTSQVFWSRGEVIDYDTDYWWEDQHHLELRLRTVHAVQQACPPALPNYNVVPHAPAHLNHADILAAHWLLREIIIMHVGCTIFTYLYYIFCGTHCRNALQVGGESHASVSQQSDTSIRAGWKSCPQSGHSDLGARLSSCCNRCTGAQAQFAAYGSQDPAFVILTESGASNLPLSL